MSYVSLYFQRVGIQYSDLCDRLPERTSTACEQVPACAGIVSTTDAAQIDSAGYVPDADIDWRDVVKALRGQC